MMHNRVRFRVRFRLNFRLDLGPRKDELVLCSDSELRSSQCGFSDSVWRELGLSVEEMDHFGLGLVLLGLGSAQSRFTHRVRVTQGEGKVGKVLLLGIKVGFEIGVGFCCVSLT